MAPFEGSLGAPPRGGRTTRTPRRGSGSSAPRARRESRWGRPCTSSEAAFGISCSAGPSADIDLAVEGDGLALRGQARRRGGRPAGAPSRLRDGVDRGCAEHRRDPARAHRHRGDAPRALRGTGTASAGLAGAASRTTSGAGTSPSTPWRCRLGPASFGRLLDPHGGQADLARRRLRPLHPLSFVEDPTRIFRAARYGARLGLRLAGDARRALAAALLSADLTGGFPALAGQRLAAELALVAAEASGWRLSIAWRAGERCACGIPGSARRAGRCRRGSAPPLVSTPGAGGPASGWTAPSWRCWPRCSTRIRTRSSDAWPAWP